MISIVIYYNILNTPEATIKCCSMVEILSNTVPERSQKYYRP